MALSADTILNFELGYENDIPAAASTTIYRGAAVGLSSGYARGLVAGDKFAGFSEANVDNSAGSAGDKNARVREKGKVVLSVTGVTGVGDKGKIVYASADDTYTLTSGSNSAIGRVVRHISGTSCLVEFDASRAGLGSITALTDNSGGTSANTIAAIGGTYNQAEVANAIASLAAKVNAIEKQL